MQRGDASPGARSGPAGRPEPTRLRSRQSGARAGASVGELPELLAFAIGAAVPCYLALDDGGFDVVVRQEFAVAIWWLLALGFVLGFLPRHRFPRGAGMAVAGFAVLAGVMTISLTWTASDGRTVAELARLTGYAGVVVAAWSLLGRRTSVAAAAGLATGALAICAIAVASRLVPGSFPSDPLERAIGSERLSHPFGYWNGLAAWAAMAVAMALAWSVDGRDWRVRAAFLAAAPVAVTAVYLTYSRGGVLALALGVAIVIALSRNRQRAAVHALALIGSSVTVMLVIRSQPAIADGSGSDGASAVILALCAAVAVGWGVARATRGLGRRSATEAFPGGESGTRVRRRSASDRVRVRRRWAIAAAVTAAVALLALATGAGSALLDEFDRGDAEIAPSSDPSQRLTSTAGNRPAYWDAALDAAGSQPVRGIGAGTFGFWWAMHGDHHELVADAHSLYVEALAETGIVGLVGLCLALAGLGLAAIRGRAAALSRAPAPATAMLAAFGVYVAIAAIDWFWELTAVTVLGLAAGAVASMTGAEHRPGQPRVRRGRAGAPALAIAGVAVVAGAVQVPGIVATERSRASDSQLEVGDAVEAAALADDAVAAAPWEAEPYAVRARAQLALGALPDARADAEAAVTREPLEADRQLLVAEIELRLGDADAAEAALNRALELSPRSTRLGRPDVGRMFERIARLRGAVGN